MSIHDGVLVYTGVHTERTSLVQPGYGESFFLVTSLEAGKRAKSMYIRTLGAVGTCYAAIKMLSTTQQSTKLVEVSLTSYRYNDNYSIKSTTPLLLNALLLCEVWSVSNPPPTGLVFTFTIG